MQPDVVIVLDHTLQTFAWRHKMLKVIHSVACITRVGIIVEIRCYTDMFIICLAEIDVRAGFMFLPYIFRENTHTPSVTFSSHWERYVQKKKKMSTSVLQSCNFKEEQIKCCYIDKQILHVVKEYLPGKPDIKCSPGWQRQSHTSLTVHYCLGQSSCYCTYSYRYIKQVRLCAVGELNP